RTPDTLCAAAFHVAITRRALRLRVVPAPRCAHVPLQRGSVTALDSSGPLTGGTSRATVVGTRRLPSHAAPAREVRHETPAPPLHPFRDRRRPLGLCVRERLTRNGARPELHRDRRGPPVRARHRVPGDPGAEARMARGASPHPVARRVPPR